MNYEVGADRGVIPENKSVPFLVVPFLVCPLFGRPTGTPSLISETKLTKGAGTYNYVVLEDGHLVVGREFNGLGGGHIDLAAGAPVISAGSVKIVGGKIKYIDNSSGHYEPSGTSAKVAAEKAFSEKGFEVKDKYIEKIWVADPVNPRKGKWTPKNE